MSLCMTNLTFGMKTSDRKRYLLVSDFRFSIAHLEYNQVFPLMKNNKSHYFALKFNHTKKTVTTGAFTLQRRQNHCLPFLCLIASKLFQLQ